VFNTIWSPKGNEKRKIAANDKTVVFSDLVEQIRRHLAYKDWYKLTESAVVRGPLDVKLCS
jgi:hypothetical protein